MWIWIVVLVVLGYVILSATARAKSNSEVKKFFADEELEEMNVRGFLRGWSVDPLKEEEVIAQYKNQKGKIDRNELLKWLIQHAESEKPGSGRKVLNMAGFRSVAELR